MKNMRTAYFELFDDMTTSKRWYLDEPEGPDGEWLGTALTRGEVFTGKTPLRCKPHHEGPAVPFTMAFRSVPIVNEPVAELFRLSAADDAQLIPIDVQGHPGAYFAVNATHAPDCIDEARCEEVRHWTEEDERPDRLGEYSRVMGLRIDPVRAGGHAVLRPRGWWVTFIISGEIADLLRAHQVRCQLTPVT